MTKRVTNWVAAILLVASAHAFGQGKLVLGQIDISFYAVTGQVVQAVLERLGHEVQLKTGTHSQIFPQLGEANNGVLVAHKSFVASAPKNTVLVLSRIELGLAAVAEMDYMVRVDGMTPRDAARKWMDANRDRVDGWFSG